MHKADQLPLVEESAAMRDVLLVMTAKTFGCAGVVKKGKLAGIITDGDLRRHMRNDLLQAPVDGVMTASPKTVRPDQLASEALQLLNTSKITALIVVCSIVFWSTDRWHHLPSFFIGMIGLAVFALAGIVGNADIADLLSELFPDELARQRALLSVEVTNPAAAALSSEETTTQEVSRSTSPARSSPPGLGACASTANPTNRA